MFYINENIPCRELSSKNLQKYIETISLEFSLRNRKWLCIGLYKPPNQNENVFLDYLSKVLTSLAVCYDNFTLLGDFNLTIENKNLDLKKNLFSI